MRNAILLCLVLTACSGDRTPEGFDPQAKADEQAKKAAAADQRALAAGFKPGAPEPMDVVRLDPPKTPAPGAILPPAERQYRYLGSWAATPKLCETGAWRFTTRKLVTAGETHCDLPDVASTPSGYSLGGVCHHQGVKTEQTLKLTFNEANKSMTVRGATLGPATLIYCGA